MQPSEAVDVPALRERREHEAGGLGQRVAARLDAGRGRPDRVVGLERVEVAREEVRPGNAVEDAEDRGQLFGARVGVLLVSRGEVRREQPQAVAVQLEQRLRELGQAVVSGAADPDLRQPRNVDVEHAVALGERELHLELACEHRRRPGPGFLKRHRIRLLGANDLRDRGEPVTAAVPDVVRQDPHRPMITSPSNPRLKLVRRLESRRQREKLGLFACEGEDLVAAALDAGLEPLEALIDAERPALADRLPAAELVEPRLLADVSTLGHPPRVVAVFRRADLPAGERAVGVALWHVGDPGNVGTLIRTADALGPASIALSAGCADPTGPKALRATAGAIFRVPITRFDDAPRPRIALIAHGGTPLADVELGESATFVLGAEREGLPDDVVSACERTATIPQAAGAESLNVAVAGAIALYEWRRARGGGG